MVRENKEVDQRRLHLAFASELLRAGETETAIRELESLKTDITVTAPEEWSTFRRELTTALAIGYLRLGEDQNCCSVNTPDSCLLPIKGAGIHTRPYGSVHAIALLEELLDQTPSDLRTRWLLNVACMTLGKYPGGVPQRWLIPPKTFRSEYPLPAFSNVSSLTGLSELSRSGGTVVDDLDGDGLPDILISSIGSDDSLRFYHNNGNGSFSNLTVQEKLGGIPGGASMIQGDYDNDGRTDVFIVRDSSLGLNRAYPTLLRNGPNGFTDVTRDAGLHKQGPATAACWLDYDNDGLLDLFVGYQSTSGHPNPCALFHNNGNGTFTDVAQTANLSVTGMVSSVVSVDYDGDGLPDLYITMGDGTPGILMRNMGGGLFKDVTAEAGLSSDGGGSTALFFDFDNDGRPDLFRTSGHVSGSVDVVADYLGKSISSTRAHLFRNMGNGKFQDVSHTAGLDRVLPGQSVNCGDLDNDGFLDLYVGTGGPDLDMLVPNRMFRNDHGRRFLDVTTSGNFGHLQKCSGIAFADLNNDGRQDVFAHMGGFHTCDTAYSALFASPASAKAGSHWLKLRLKGVKSNSSAIGARVKVVTRSSGGRREIYRTISSGSLNGSGPLRLDIGLGDARSIDRVEIIWPRAGRSQILRGLSIDRFYTVREDTDTAAMMPLRAFAWPKTSRIGL